MEMGSLSNFLKMGGKREKKIPFYIGEIKKQFLCDPVTFAAKVRDVQL